jgi:hypothetical protein
MAAGEIHVGDVGVAIRVQLYDETNKVVDVSGVTVQMVLRPPVGTNLLVNATYVNDGKDGLIQYITQVGDLNKAGNWKLQSIINFATGPVHSDVTTFKVYPNI